MFKNTDFFLVFILLIGLISCGNKTGGLKYQKKGKIAQISSYDSLSPIDNIDSLTISYPVNYLHLIKEKVIGIIANQTSVVKNSNSGFTHLVDTLISLKIDVRKVFSPEHGFRGIADAGELVSDGKDTKTGLPLISLYGKNKKPSQQQLKGIELMIFDIQDVGVRFYTYLSTLHYVMEACAEANIPLIVIDRPNLNAHYIDGPMMEKEHQSFLGKHPVPLVYGMTIGEYAMMINGEKWLTDNLKCDLTVMPMKNYAYHNTYSLPIKPSPNLPNSKAINLYPSLALFEGTSMNAGRGTEMQFQIFGAPYLDKRKYPFVYTPKANVGARDPKQKGNLCNGLDLRENEILSTINLDWLIQAYNDTPKDQEFFQATFTAHAGTKKLREQIENGISAEAIRRGWQPGLERFKEIRGKYLIYK